jgi:hypothetical protein
MSTNSNATPNLSSTFVGGRWLETQQESYNRLSTPKQALSKTSSSENERRITEMTGPIQPSPIHQFKQTLPTMEEMAQRVATAIELYGENSEQVVTAIRDLAVNAYKLGPNHFNHAKEIFHQLLFIQSNLYGERSAHVAETYHTLSAVENTQKDYASAAAHLRRALDIYSELRANGNPASVASDKFMTNWYKTLCTYYRMSKQPDLAKQMESEHLSGQ